MNSPEMTPEEWLAQTTRCLACREADMEAMSGNLVYEIDDYRIEVLDVPMKVCPNCGERYIPGPIAEIVSALTSRVLKTLRNMAIEHNQEPMPFKEVTMRYKEQHHVPMGSRVPMFAD